MEGEKQKNRLKNMQIIYLLRSVQVVLERNYLHFLVIQLKTPMIAYTVNSRLADTPPLRTLAITDKIQIPGERGLIWLEMIPTITDSRYDGH